MGIIFVIKNNGPIARSLAMLHNVLTLGLLRVLDWSGEFATARRFSESGDRPVARKKGAFGDI